MALVQKGAIVAGGAMIAKWLPARFMPALATKPPEQQALVQIGTGLAISMVAGRFLGRQLAENLAVGAIASGATTFIQKFMPGMTGLGLGQIPITESEIDREIQELVEGGVGDLGNLGMAEEFMVESMPYEGE